MQEKVSDNLRNKLEVLDITSQLAKKNMQCNKANTLYCQIILFSTYFEISGILKK